MRVTVAVLILSGIVVVGQAALPESPARAAQKPASGRPVVVFEPSGSGGVRAVLKVTVEQEQREYVLEAASIRAENTENGLEIAADGAAIVTLTTGRQLTLESAKLLVARDGVEPAVSMSGRARTDSRTPGR